MPEEHSQTQTAFFIAPIGADRSDERVHSDLVLELLVRPACRLVSLEIKRADEIFEPGVITEQVVDRLLAAPLVVADISRHNPNVFYEIAICHAKPVPLVLIGDVQSIPPPFDASANQVLTYNPRNVPDLKDRQPVLRQFIEHAREHPGTDSPV